MAHFGPQTTFTDTLSGPHEPFVLVILMMAALEFAPCCEEESAGSAISIDFVEAAKPPNRAPASGTRPRARSSFNPPEISPARQKMMVINTAQTCLRHAP
jgi:hypothetical protein